MNDRFVISGQHPILAGHHVQSEAVLPGLAYVDLLAHLWRKHGHDPLCAEFGQLTLYRAMVVPPGHDMVVELDWSELGEHGWRVTVHGQLQRDGQQVGERLRYAQAMLRQLPRRPAFDARLDLEQIKTQALRTTNLDEIYADRRRRGLVHDDFMRARGTLYETADALVVHCEVGPEALQHSTQAQVLFHPVLLDGGAVAAGGLPASAQASGPLYLPLHVESFRASVPLQRACTLRRVKHEHAVGSDLSVMTLEFFDAEGRQVAELKNLGSKLVRAARDESAGSPSPAKAVSAAVDRSEALHFLQQVLGARLGRAAQAVDVDLGYYELGLNSLTLLELVQDISERVGTPLSPTLLFEHATASALAAYLMSHHGAAFELGAAGAGPQSRLDAPPFDAQLRQADAHEPIAIIGMSGRFPKARDLREFWQHLLDGVDCIEEVPSERWRWQSLEGRRSATGKGISRWGGFIEGVDRFDPQFFRISPREAETMDPQERLFLQEAWSALEDSGHTPATLVPSQGPLARRRVGVYAGVMHKDYAQIGAELNAFGAGVSVIQTNAGIANRVSFVCGFHGPSMVVDTLCSSSLVAVHLAVQSLRRGECDAAIAGGVNLSLHPAKYLTYGAMGMHASDGRCRTFGEGGDGYVSAEGVGAVVLKPLSRAQADGDAIYAVIRASSTNHVGAASGYTVPSPQAQADAVRCCLEESGIDPSTIGYVEAHGTGTSLGDPIEIAGLTQAYRLSTDAQQFCAIGSVKSNIGHAESAAGVAGLIKVALQLEHRMMVPSLHSARPNPHIDWASSPFHLQREASPWPAVQRDGRALPRRAGLSSIGAAGANVHVLLEEAPVAAARAGRGEPVLVVLSAKSPDRLGEHAARLLAHVQREGSALALDAFAATLQRGRVAFEHRAALVASDLASLEGLLRAVAEGDAGERAREGLHLGHVRPGAADLAAWSGPVDLQGMAQAWVQGASIDWGVLYPQGWPRRLHLPAYPYAQERHWYLAAPQAGAVPGMLHPLLHANTSELDEQRYSTRLTGREFFLSDHVVQGRKVLPGVAQLEMAREAVRRALGLPEGDLSVQLRGVVFARPVVVEDVPVELHVALQAQDDTSVAFELYSGAGDDTVLHSQGSAIPMPGGADLAPLDLRALLSGCPQTLSASEFYKTFEDLGIACGPAMRGVRCVHVGPGVAVAEVLLPASADAAGYVLHPSLMDAALQSSLGLASGAGDAGGSGAPLPYALEELRVHAPLPPELRVLVRPAADAVASARVRKLDIMLADREGRVCVTLRGFASRNSRDSEATDSRVGAFTFTEAWEPEEAVAATAPGTGAVVFVLSGGGASAELDAAWRGQTGTAAECIVVTEADVPAQGPAFAQVQAADATSWASALAAVAARHGEISALVDLRAVEMAEALSDHGALVAMLQGLAKSKLTCRRLVLVGQVASDLERCELDAWIGYERSLRQALPATAVVVLGSDEPRGTGAYARWVPRLEHAVRAPLGEHVYYGQGRRHVLRLRPGVIEGRPAVLGPGGQVLITGGAGGLGWLFAQHLATAHGLQVTLSGRSQLAAHKQALLDEFNAGVRGGAGRVRYVQADVCQEADMRKVFALCARDGLGLRGVIHAAGVAPSQGVLDCVPADLQRVMAPKVEGSMLLERLCREFGVEWLCHFSSSAAVLGDFGACLYAVANRFQAARAAWGNAGPTKVMALEWPLWKSEGMQVGDDAGTRRYLESSGQVLLDAQRGLPLFEQLLAQGPARTLVLVGQARRVDRLIDAVQGGAQPTPVSRPAPVADAADATRGVPPPEELAGRAARHLARLLAKTLRLPAEKIDPLVPLEHYGIDSMLVMELTKVLERQFGQLSKTLFFEYQTIDALAGYFVQHHADALAAQLGAGLAPTRLAESAAARDEAAPEVPGRRRRRARSLGTLAAEAGDIAIIGLAGRYPKAADVGAYWRNLLAGVDCITEVPAERWDHSRYHDPQRGKRGKAYAKWGGFIDDADRFDPLFFNISPREAALIDPQERLFLQCAYAALEDAGHTRTSLSPTGKVGVFAGVMYQDYQLYGAQSQALGGHHVLGSTPASIANRVSYWCNFHGPSMVVDTMCSSSLTAIHLACVSLRRGECDAAIAGGVNLSLHPNKYLGLSAGQFASSEGLCRSFGEGGDGYVPGEGVGAVLLKPLARALEEGDHIYGVIKASTVNHGGKTNGYTVPNPNAQAELVERALREAGVDARAVSYIEAHGTGTSLGDPIEIAGLTKAFGQFTRDTQFCAIGSAKSNIGHCESAAGMAGLTKVLLQLQHGQIVKSLHSERLNPHIDFTKTPFVVQQSLADWRRPHVVTDGVEQELPRIAGLSGFGAGGGNAHLIVQEHVDTRPQRQASGPALVLLSARDETRLRERAGQLLEALNVAAPPHLADLAYTLQVGRDAMESRYACVVDDIDALKGKLAAYLQGELGEECFVGQTRESQEALAPFSNDPQARDLILGWAQQGRWVPVAQAWVRGLNVEWQRLYLQDRPRRISLPTYPFARERCWPDDLVLEGSAGAGDALHPLLRANTSTLSEQRYSQRFTGQEFFLRDHVVQGLAFLPGAAQLEMAQQAFRAAIEASVQSVVTISHVAFVRPVVVSASGLEVHVTLVPQGDGVQWRIHSVGGEGETVVHSEGHAQLGDRDCDPETLGLADLQAGVEREAGTDELYRRYAQVGLTYGPAMRGVQQVGCGRDAEGPYVLARVRRPDEATRDARYMLHPSILDSAFQSGIGLSFFDDAVEAATSRRPVLPFAFDRVEVYAALPDDAWVLVREQVGVGGGLRKFDFQIADAQGRLCASLLGYAGRAMGERPALGEPAVLRWVVLTDFGEDELGETEQAVRAGLPLAKVMLLRPRGQGVARRQAESLAQLQAHLREMPRPGHARVWLQLVVPESGSEQGLQALTGLLSAAAADMPELHWRVLSLPFTTDAATVAARVAEQASPFEGEPRQLDAGAGETPPTAVLNETTSIAKPVGAAATAASQVVPSMALREATIRHLKQMLAGSLKLAPERLDASVPLEQYGIDSVLVMRLTGVLEETFGTLSKTLFFEYQTLGQLADYFVAKHKPQMERLVGQVEPQAKAPRRELPPPAPVRPAPRWRNLRAPAARSLDGGQDEAIAIVGLAGVYPKAPDVGSFWRNLLDGVNCVSEVPPERWDHRRYADAQPGKRGKTYARWGGFIDGHDRFDPLFFNISPREAVGMDPQERLFLQTAHAAIEDAGYTREELARLHDESGLGANVGVFVGVMYEDYQLYGAQSQMLPDGYALAGSIASVANRVSYWFNFHGPSMAVDTMCSSSLTAVHLACESLRRGDCEAAVAGGVNLTVHPNKLLLLGQARFASSEGLCRTFGAGGDGYVPAEGVGAVLLKPLRRALQDGDHVYGVIKACALNHGGKTNGYSVPNPNAQARVIARALERAGVHPRSVSYLEAHGTGTALGDPIEITGLSQAFGELTPDTGFCAIGSAKSNIGHAESAAGIAGLTKVLLQIQHQTLVKSLHSETLNPHIEFGRTPFVVQRDTAQWKRPLIDIDGVEREFPRTAGVSAFGAGGSNAHLIVQEHVDVRPRSEQVGPVLIVISAKTDERLHVQVRRLLEALRAKPELELAAIAYTLQVGRAALEVRLACVVSSPAELCEMLQAWVDGLNPEGLHRGEVKRHPDGLPTATPQEESQERVAGWLAQGQLDKLAAAWVQGTQVDWHGLHAPGSGRRVSLPTYPFAQDRYWLDTRRLADAALSASTTPAVLHPLVHANTSSFSGQRYTSRFTGGEFFLRDHHVHGEAILPGVAHLELARHAAELALQGEAGAAMPAGAALSLQDVAFMQPLKVGAQGIEVHISLQPDGDGVAWEIHGQDAGGATVYSQGRVVHGGPVAPTRVDLAALQAALVREQTADDCYAHYERLGMRYGPTMRGVQQLGAGRDAQGEFVLARVRCPEASASEEFGLHPCVLDSALHACIALGLLNEGAGGAAGHALLPFAIEELVQHADLGSGCWVLARPVETGAGGRLTKLDLWLADDTGSVCMELRGLTSRVLQADRPDRTAPEVVAETLVFDEQWVERPLEAPSTVQPDGCVVCVLSSASARAVIDATLQLQAPGVARAYLVAEGDAAALDSACLQAPPYDADALALSLKTLGERHGGVRALLYLPALEDAAALADHLRITTLLQAVARSETAVRQLVLAGECRDDLGRCHLDAWVGYERSLGRLLPETHVSVVGAEAESGRSGDMGRWVSRLWDEVNAKRRSHAFYVQGRRHGLQLKQRMLAPHTTQLRRGGHYLITGGVGGLGWLFAEHLVKVHDARVTLSGRSALDASKQARLDSLADRAIYLPADVTDRAQMSAMLDRARAHFGPVTGVLHAAGVAPRGSVLNTSRADLVAIMGPKIEGSLLLADLLADHAPDFICHFSSSSAILGDFGACSYAVANRFQAALARWPQRRGSPARVVSIEWPLWGGGGMQVGNDEATARYLGASGQSLLTGPQGLALFEHLMSCDGDRHLVLVGEAHRLARLLEAVQGPVVMVQGPATEQPLPHGAGDVPAPAVIAPAERAAGAASGLEDKTARFLARLLAQTLKMAPDQLDPHVPLEDYGIDSVLVMELTQTLERSFGRLAKTLFFEYQTLHALAAYFLNEHRAALVSLLGEPTTPARVPPQTASPAAVRRMAPASRMALPAPRRGHASDATADIAIIGLAGRYPQAADVQTYWKNLLAGLDCVTEIPPGRWDLRDYQDDGSGAAGKTYARWGGFIDDAECFDPLFFNIAPREAMGMDPQERVFLQCVHAALEDAGYTRHNLAPGGQVAVFAGAMYQEYQLYAAQSQLGEQGYAVNGNISSIANRVSYWCGFTGPSVTVDTMCSSSLTALHMAVQSLRHGGCAAAIAGGVNLSIHPNKYLLLASGQFASSEGLCRSFGEGGDGYVPAEGVGAVVLKPLQQALADGDHIHGVIKATAINHGGKTNGYTVPNPVAQSQVIAQALQESGVEARAVSYIEAHGTGTSLGDPIEIAGLSKAFGMSSTDRQYCAIGSAKSNIGHAESAAGMAGLTKVLLQMRHKTLVKSLHSEVLNPHIDFANTPFVVQRANAPWARPVIAGRERPRVAGLSGFGAGGSNAHVIVQEYEHVPEPANGGQAELVLLSARGADRLQARARQLLDALAPGGAAAEVTLAQVAYTLQVGREAMEDRLACVASTHEGLAALLEAHLRGETPEGVWRGDAKRDRAMLALFNGDDDMQAAIDTWAAKGKLGKLAELWVQGVNLDWARLRTGAAPRRASLPTYPFLRERYWPNTERILHLGAAPKREGNLRRTGQQRLHPLVHANASGAGQLRYCSSFDGDEFFLRGHRIRGECVMPGAAQIEMASHAARLAAGIAGAGHVRLEEVVFAQPLTVGGEGRDVQVALTPDGDDWGWTIFSREPGRDGEATVHSEGRVYSLSETERGAAVDLASLQSAAVQALDLPALYARLEGAGLEHGVEMRGLQTLHAGADDAGQFVLARVRRPDAAGDAEGYVLHPAMLDAALVAGAGLSLGREPGEQDDVAASGALVPFAIDALDIHAEVNTSAWVVVRPMETKTPGLRKLTVVVLDDQGAIALSLQGLSCRTSNPGLDTDAVDGTAELPASDAASIELHMVQPRWMPAATEPAELDSTPGTHLICVAGIGSDETDEVLDALRAEMPSALVQELASGAQGLGRRYTEMAAQFLALLQQVAAARDTSRLVQLLVPAWGDDQVMRGMAGMLRSAALENPRIRIQVLAFQAEVDSATLARRTRDESQRPDADVLLRSDGQREVMVWQPVAACPEPASPWAPGGVYLITGGAGGLGLLFARHIAEQAPGARLVLVGRSAVSQAVRQALAALHDLGAQAEYLQVDMSRRHAVSALVERVLQQHGQLTGILHAAGVLRDGLMSAKTEGVLREVLAPKVTGLENLDWATRDLKLDVFVAFSSVAGAYGNFGQADYAAANAFMDSYIALRAQRVARGERSGRSLSVNWGLWEHGGMQPDEAAREAMLHAAGAVPMPTSVGLSVLTRALSGDAAQVAVWAGARHKAEAAAQAGLDLKHPGALSETGAAPLAADSASVLALLRARLRDLLSAQTGVAAGRIDDETGFDRYGIESVATMKVTALLQSALGKLPRTLLFEYPTISLLAQELMRLRGHEVTAWLGSPDQGRAKVTRASNDAPVAASKARSPGETPQHKPITLAARRTSDARRVVAGEGDIAIVGLSGVYPRSPDLDALWRNILEGVDCVQEVPAERWPAQDWYAEGADAPGRTQGRWGGFIEGVDRFDPLHFGIAPSEAAGLDPQVRLFMQTVWHLLESSGQTRESLKHRHAGKVGVYVGAMYQQYRADAASVDVASMVAMSSYSAIANRVSHYFGFEGPSLAVDTMCSSSAMAIHLACRALRAGECELAVAGGVNLSIDPRKYVALSRLHLMASDPMRRSFADGDGYTPCEGVGAVMLKPLARARADGDRIWAVVKGTAAAHAGHSGSYGAPVSQMQARVMQESLADAGLAADDISYVESAATGSALGDAMEVSALGRVFGRRERACPVGSVKSNLGHPEAVSGMAQLSKAVLQLRHRQLAPSILCAPPNPDLDFPAAGLRLQVGAEAWTVPEGARRATLINSFGAGGTYVSLVIDEAPLSVETLGCKGPALLVLSARNTGRLRELAGRLADHLAARLPDAALHAVAATLQLGREAMPQRLACVAENAEGAVSALRGWLAGEAPPHLYVGDLDAPQDERAASSVAVEDLLARRDLAALAAHWVSGGHVAWPGLYGEGVPPVVDLPAYPFEQSRYWLPTLGRVPQQLSAPALAAVETQAHGVREQVLAVLAAQIGLPAKELATGRPLAEYGVDSVLGMRLLRALSATCGVSLSGRDLLAHPTAQGLIDLVESRLANRPQPVPPAPSAEADRVTPAEIEVLEMFREGAMDLSQLKELLRHEDLL